MIGIFADRRRGFVLLAGILGHLDQVDTFGVTMTKRIMM